MTSPASGFGSLPTLRAFPLPALPGSGLAELDPATLVLPPAPALGTSTPAGALPSFAEHAKIDGKNNSARAEVRFMVRVMRRSPFSITEGKRNFGREAAGIHMVKRIPPLGTCPTGTLQPSAGSLSRNTTNWPSWYWEPKSGDPRGTVAIEGASFSVTAVVATIREQ